MRQLYVTALVMSLGVSTEPLSTAQSTQPPSYETYCSADARAKREMFRAMTAEQKVAIWRTQIRRFTEAHRARLTTPQLQLLDDFSEAIPLGVAAGPKTPEVRSKLEAIEARLEAGFAREDARLLDEDGPCIPAVSPTLPRN